MEKVELTMTALHKCELIHEWAPSLYSVDSRFLKDSCAFTLMNFRGLRDDNLSHAGVDSFIGIL